MLCFQDPLEKAAPQFLTSMRTSAGGADGRLAARGSLVCGSDASASVQRPHTASHDADGQARNCPHSHYSPRQRRPGGGDGWPSERRPEARHARPRRLTGQDDLPGAAARAFQRQERTPAAGQQPEHQLTRADAAGLQREEGGDVRMRSLISRPSIVRDQQGVLRNTPRTGRTTRDSCRTNRVRSPCASSFRSGRLSSDERTFSGVSSFLSTTARSHDIQMAWMRRW